MKILLLIYSMCVLVDSFYFRNVNRDALYLSIFQLYLSAQAILMCFWSSVTFTNKAAQIVSDGVSVECPEAFT